MMNQSGRALMLDDDRNAPGRISEAFEAMNFETANAGRGREALAFASSPYDVALAGHAGTKLHGTSLLDSGGIDQDRPSPGKGFLWGGVISLALWVVLGVLLANCLS